MAKFSEIGTVTTPQNSPGRNVGWLFQAGLGDLHEAYNEARDAFLRDLRRNKKSFDRLRDDPEDNKDPLGYELHLASIHDETIQHLSLLREAFTIMLFHFWERKAKLWTGGRNYDDKKTLAVLRGWGIEPMEKELEVLQLTANTAKHSSGRSANDLFMSRPDMFDVDLFDGAPTYDALRIAEDDLQTFFNAVKKSGPPRQRLQF